MSEEENMTAAESPGIYGFLGPVLMIAMIAIAFAGASVNWIDMADTANLNDIAMPLVVLLLAGVRVRRNEGGHDLRGRST